MFYFYINMTVVGLVVFMPLEVCINCLAKRVGMRAIKIISLVMIVMHASLIPLTIILYFTR